MARKRSKRLGKPRKEPAEPVKALARRVRELRRERGLSQMRLCAQAGVNLSYLAKVESARASPSVEYLAKLAEALGVGVGEMLAPRTQAGEPLTALREQAHENMARAIRKADRVTLEAIAVLGGLLANALSRNR